MKWYNFLIKNGKGKIAMENVIKGWHTCFCCNNEFEWEHELRIIPYQVRKVPNLKADAYAIGNANGTVQYEVICQCPHCGIKNKFLYD